MKDIPWYEWLYTISEYWYVFNVKRKKYISQIISHWYARVFLWNGWIRKSFFVHRIVCLCYNKKNKVHTEVNHKDGIKRNNHCSNLEWCTHRENLFHSVNTLLSKHGKRKKVIQFSLLWEKLREFDSLRDASRLLSVSVSWISRCLKLGTKKYAWYLWSFQ